MNKLFFLLFLLAIFAFQFGFSQTGNPVGDAQALSGDCYQVTASTPNQSGAVWFTEQLDLSEYFALTVEVNLGTNDGGADGIVLVMQQVGLDALGISGVGLGFEGFAPSFGLEFDTRDNIAEGNGDLFQDHMAMLINGTVDHNSASNIAGPTPIFPGGENAENGQPIILRLVWEPVSQQISAFIDCELRLSANLDLVGEVFMNDPSVFWGFTGATGAAFNEQTVCFKDLVYFDASPSQTICEGDDLQLSINNFNPQNAVWSPNQDIDDINSISPIVNPTVTTIYAVEYESCGEIFTDVIEVVVLPELTLDEILPMEVCSGETAEFEAIYPASYDIEWSTGLQNSSTETYDQAGQYWVEVTDGICSKRVEFELTTLESPVIDVVSQVEYCAGGSTLVTFSSPTASTTTYDPDGNQGGSFSASQPLTYTVSAINTITQCETQAEVLAIEVPLPVFQIQSNYDICSYETLNVSVDSSYDVQWSNGATASSTNYSVAGTHSVTAEFNGCANDTEFTLTVNLAPVSGLPGAYEFCEDVPLTLSMDDPALRTTWHDGSTADSFTYTESGVYQIETVDISTECVEIGNVDVTRLLNPVIELNEEYFLCDGDRTTVRPVIRFSDQISWSNGSQADEFTFDLPEEFSIRVSNFCKEIEEFSEVKNVICECDSYIPVAFTPDNDGLNEVFKPIITCDPPEYELAIYDRYGELVFQTFDLTEGWRGNHKNGNHYVPNGVYTYKMSYQLQQFDGLRTEIRYGMISVFR